ncbi:hypothetical protein L1887_58468 [Cichorium endivia]|nr:hypothetical protein L1887_58468 [Cichorium endivia]
MSLRCECGARANRGLGATPAGQQRSWCGAAKLPPPQQSRKSSAGAAHVAAMQFGSTEHPPILSPPVTQPCWPFFERCRAGSRTMAMQDGAGPLRSVRAVELRVSLQATGFGFSDPWISPVTDVTPNHRNS